MRFTRTISSRRDASSAGFTLAEVLAALLFMAIVIPTAVHGLRIASLAGHVGERKAEAARIAESVLNEMVVTRQWQTGSPSGLVQEGPIAYRWSMRAETWNYHSVLRLLTVMVSFPIQGQDYEVRLSTVVDSSL